MPVLTLLALVLCGPLLTGPAAAAPVSAAPTAAGLVVSADLREEYLTGFPMLVTLTVRNDGAQAQAFPDLIARPHLVRFTLDGPKGKSERYTTPPAFDAATSWTIPPKSERRVVVEIPSSAAFGAGDYRLSVTVADPAGTVVVPERTVRLAAAKPVAGTAIHEPTIAANVGAMIPWVHQAAAGFDLYLMQFDARAPGRVVAQYALAHLEARVEPVLARARPGDAMARHVYWQAAPGSLTVARLDGPMLRAAPRTYTLPYPKVELLDRGVTDARGGLTVPVWVPAPTGTAGTVRAVWINERGQVALRTVADLPARPTVVATAVDAGSNLLVALGHPAGVDLYRVDNRQPVEVPAQGVRAWRGGSLYAPAALAFDILPAQGQNPGGLALLSVVTATADGVTTYQSRWHDLGGKTLAESPVLPWALPGRVTALLPEGYGAFYALSSDGGAWWYAAQGGTASKVDGRPGALWASASTVYLRHLGGGRVVEDLTLGPRQP